MTAVVCRKFVPGLLRVRSPFYFQGYLIMQQMGGGESGECHVGGSGEPDGDMVSGWGKSNIRTPCITFIVFLI